MRAKYSVPRECTLCRELASANHCKNGQRDVFACEGEGEARAYKDTKMG